MPMTLCEEEEKRGKKFTASGGLYMEATVHVPPSDEFVHCGNALWRLSAFNVRPQLV